MAPQTVHYLLTESQKVYWEKSRASTVYRKKFGPRSKSGAPDGAPQKNGFHNGGGLGQKRKGPGRCTTKFGAPERGIDGGSGKRGPGNRKNGAPERRGPGRGTGRGKKKWIPRPTPQSGPGRGFSAGPREIRGPACPGANTSYSRLK